MTLILTVFALNRKFQLLAKHKRIMAYALSRKKAALTEILSILLFSLQRGKLIALQITISRKEYTVFRSSFRFSCFQFMPVVLFLLLSCALARQAQAENLSTEEWNISADKLVRYEDPSSIVAQGDVVLIKKERLPPPRSAAEIKFSQWSELLEETAEDADKAAGDVEQSAAPEYQTVMTIKADWIVYDMDLESIKAKGNVQISTTDAQLFAQAGTLQLATETGIFSDATIFYKENSLHLEGKKIEKTGPDTYRIDDGWVITCKLESGQTPPWSFSSSKTNVRQDGYAVLKHARFNIRNVPVFYTPFLLVPVKNTRQSGFLFPEFSASDNNGFGFNLPFFLNISESADATFYPAYLHNRGFMPGVEFRYVASASDKGVITANYLDDKLSDPAETEYYNDTGYTHDNSDRYWIRGKADHSFAGWQSRLDLDIVSDQDYLKEFDSGVTGFEKTHNRYLDTFGRGFQNESDALRENTFNTLRTWNGTSLQANLLAINNADTDAGSTDTPLWQLPSIDYSGVIPLGDSYFNLDWDTNYVNYWREDGIGGHRFDVNPSISSPIPLGPYLESRAELSLRDTFYVVETYGEETWDNNNVQNRLYPEFEYELATTLEKDFFSASNSNPTTAHQVRPFVKYGYLPDVDQKDLPAFDDVDFIEDKQAITYGVDNYLSSYTYYGGSEEDPYTFLELKIEQAFDLRTEASDQPFSEIFSELKWNLFSGTALSYKTYFDIYDSAFNRHNFEGQYTNARGDYLNLDYSFNEAENIEQLNAYFLARLYNGWSAGGSIEHSLSLDETIESRGSLIYQAPCWSVRLETRYTPEDTTYLVIFSLANIGVPLGASF
jgi:LPS-assembly protein